MMYVAALLLAFCGAALSQTTTDKGEAFSWESDSADTNSQGYNGLTIAVYKPLGGEPTITLGTDLDNNEKTFCLKFARTFEATGFNLSRSTADDNDYNEVDGSEVELTDTNCEVNETSTTTFSIVCSGINGGLLTLEFAFYTDDVADEEGLEYTIGLSGYEWVSGAADAQFVLVQELKDCSIKYKYSGDSDDGSEDADTTDDDADTTTDDDGEDDDATTTEEPENRRRRLLHDDDDDADHDHDDTEDDDADDTSVSDDGISSDDSKEYDLDYTRFVVDGQAIDDCNGTVTNITSKLVLVDGDELHLVFERFECDLFLDPHVAVVNADLYDGASMASLVVAVAAGLVGLLF